VQPPRGLQAAARYLASRPVFFFYTDLQGVTNLAPTSREVRRCAGLPPHPRVDEATEVGTKTPARSGEGNRNSDGQHSCGAPQPGQVLRAPSQPKKPPDPTIAMNRHMVAGRNDGEGGTRTRTGSSPTPNGDLRRSAGKQVASGRSESPAIHGQRRRRQIKMAQRAKPAGRPVAWAQGYKWIAMSRDSKPGVGCFARRSTIDIYSTRNRPS